MTNTTKTLRLTFLDNQKKKNVMTLANAKDGLTEDVVKTAMLDICSATVFEKDGEMMYIDPQSAAYVERSVTSIFDDSKTNDGDKA